MTDPLVAAFKNLDRWRHLPDYQLERRADLFFSVYLREVLEAKVGAPLLDVVIPEFPIRQGLLDGSNSNQSKKVDYVLFSTDKRRAFFVELKTDASSRRAEQDEYLARAVALGFRAIVVGVSDIMLATSHRKKYQHLAHLLAGLGFLVLPKELEEHVFSRSSLAPKALREVVVPEFVTSVEVIYVQPMPIAGEAGVCFGDFARALDGRTDPLSVLFREHLLRWSEEAGAPRPSSLS